MTKIAIIGAKGRMGRRLIALASESADRFEVVGAVDVGDSALGVAQVAIDFSSPEGTRHWLEHCRQRKIAMLIGTTGLTDVDRRAIDTAARDIAILQTTNTSLGVAVLNKLAADAARMLGSDYEIEIVEAHHRFKKDAPSGTALTLAESIDAKRKIPTHSLRIGDEVGTHTAIFAALGERLELTHRATSRDTFARGALRAAEWLATRPPGRYRIADVLGL